ncbi:MAG: hypothetical protein QNJ42_22925 [Crocosphaera sp.]|nr:hypothetical protein [Crocosphaera sp.]
MISQDSLDYPDEIFNFFLENGITNVGFNMEEAEGVNQYSSLNQSGIEQRYQAFMERLWELNVQCQGALKIREFETICGIAYTCSFLDYSDWGSCFIWFRKFFRDSIIFLF